MTVQTAETPDNGIDLDALLGAREALAENPGAARFTWRASNRWLGGTHSRSEISGFMGLGEEQTRGKTFAVEADHPEHFSAPDHAPTPVEIVLAALASCLTGGVAAVAQRRGIQLRSVVATVEGDMDLQGILGIDPSVRNGFSAVRVTFEVDADASDAEIAGIVAQSQKRSAVFDIITTPTAVKVTIA